MLPQEFFPLKNTTRVYHKYMFNVRSLCVWGPPSFEGNDRQHKITLLLLFVRRWTFHLPNQHVLNTYLIWTGVLSNWLPPPFFFKYQTDPLLSYCWDQKQNNKLPSNMHMIHPTANYQLPTVYQKLHGTHTVGTTNKFLCNAHIDVDWIFLPTPVSLLLSWQMDFSAAFL